MQLSLFQFEKQQNKSFTIHQVAEKLNVSAATIRNWIKVGHLKKEKNGIQEKTLHHFIHQYIGKEKLIKRANKQNKNTHNHKTLSEIILEKLKRESPQKISDYYESRLSNSYKNKEGIYYTPFVIVEDMFKNIDFKREFTFLDPCCGSGHFIIQAIKKGLSPKNVFGFDIDKNAVAITRKRILEATGFDAQQNIQHLNFLEIAYKITHKYDLIFTNPPWGKKIKKDKKQYYANQYKAGKSLDTTSLFYFSCLGLLKKGGKLGFLVQEALFNIGTFEDCRKSILQQKIIKLKNYGKPFKKLISKACAFIIEKNEKTAVIDCAFHKKNTFRTQESFLKNPKRIFNFWNTKENQEIIAHIYKKPHITLENNAIWGLGIVTGNNATFCHPKPKNGYVAVYKGMDIQKGNLKKASHFIAPNFSKYQQTAPMEMYQVPSKLIYKFISSKLVFFCDEHQRFLLNSANFLIPAKNLGITHKQLADLLNSDLMNWIFYAIFNTHKILRSDLELLPIHIDYFKNYNTFTEENYLKYLKLTKQKDGTYQIKK